LFPRTLTFASSKPTGITGHLFNNCILTFENKFCQQKGGMEMGNSLSPMVSNMFTKHVEEITLDTEDHKPDKWRQQRRQHFRGLAPWISNIAGISLPPS
jgi:hypothetical protein